MIIQLAPCNVELYARYKQDGGDFYSRIVCLALIEEEGYRHVVGMDCCEDEISSVEANSNFLAYADKPANNETSD